MTPIRRILRCTPALAIAVAASVACAEDEAFTGPDQVGSGLELASPIINRTLTQRDRFGLPAVNTAFFMQTDVKNAFNQAAPANDPAAFTDPMVATLMARYALSQANAEALAGLVLPDVQPLGALPAGGINDPLASTSLFDGRRLAEDVIDEELGVLFGPGGLSSLAPVPGLASDNVDANDVAFLAAFPFLSDPHTP